MTDGGFVLGWRQALVAGLLLSTGCADDEGGPNGGGSNCEGAKCDEVEDGGDEVGACKDVLKDLSGNGLSADQMLGATDPIGRFILSQDGACSLSVAAMAKILGEECDSHRSALVSERSQRLGTFTDYRSVTMFDCGGDDVFLHYPILAQELAGGTPLAEHLEEVSPAIIAQESSGVFNYYQSTGQDLRFFGSSLDMLDGTDLETLAEKVHGEEKDFQASFVIERSCAACHPGGGLLMKELESPWLHWEPDFFSPSADDLISSANEIMGRHTDAIDLEGTVIDGNRDVNETRIDHVLAGLGSDFDVGDLLRPLFCTDEFNTGSNFSENVSSFRFSDVVIDNDFRSPRINSSNDTYQKILEDRGSRVETAKLGAPSFKETVGGFTFLHRARIDEDYIRRLDDRGILDSELVNDIRLIDFTRSLYSDERCGLIEIAAAVDPKAVDDGAKGISDAMIEVLQGKGSLSPAERDLLANLEQAGTDPDALLEPFNEACDSRSGRGDSDDLLADYLEYAAQVRKRAASRDAGEGFGDPSFMQFRFPGVAGFSFPVDDMPVIEGFRFHPQTCEATTEYVALTDGQGGAGDPGDDADPPDDVDEGECCVTCETSQACGNGCISKSFECHQEPGCACQG